MSDATCSYLIQLRTIAQKAFSDGSWALYWHLTRVYSADSSVSKGVADDDKLIDALVHSRGVLVCSVFTQLLVSQYQKPRVRMAMPNAYTRPPIELLSDEAPIVYRATKLTVYGVQSLGVKRK